jgi:hypothetical protein
VQVSDRVEPTGPRPDFEIYGIYPVRFDHRYQPGSQRVHPDDRARVDATVRRAVETGNAIDKEYRIVRPDGRIRRIHGRAEVVFDDHGRPRRLTGTAQDVTELRAAEDALEQTAAERFRADRPRERRIAGGRSRRPWWLDGWRRDTARRW